MFNFITKVILSRVEGDFQKMELTADRIVEQNEMSIITLKTYEFDSFVMGYHAYKRLFVDSRQRRRINNHYGAY